MRHPRTFDELIPHMRTSGFIATTLAAVITAKFGWSIGEDTLAKLSLAGLLALCTYIVGYALVAAHHAYARGMRAVGHAAVALFAIGVAMEFLSHTGFTAANRDATIQQASLQQVAYGDIRGTVAAAEAKVARLTEARALIKPKAAPGAAKAVIATAEAHKWWRSTKGCTATLGAQTRAWCETYASAVADLALWDQIKTQETEIAAAESEARDAKAKSVKAEVSNASAASQGMILAAMATGSERPGQSAVFWAGVGISALIALFAIAAGGLLNFIAWAFDGAGEAKTDVMVMGGAMMTPLEAAGRDIVHTREVIRDEGFRARLRAELAANGLVHGLTAARAA